MVPRQLALQEQQLVLGHLTKDYGILKLKKNSNYA
jgi:hypothetical protein